MRYGLVEMGSDEGQVPYSVNCGVTTLRRELELSGVIVFDLPVSLPRLRKNVLDL